MIGFTKPHGICGAGKDSISPRQKKKSLYLEGPFLKRLSRFNSSERIILSLSFRSHPVCQALKQ